MGERVSVSLDRLLAWILKLICELVLLICRFFGDFNTGVPLTLHDVDLM